MDARSPWGRALALGLVALALLAAPVVAEPVDWEGILRVDVVDNVDGTSRLLHRLETSSGVYGLVVADPADLSQLRPGARVRVRGERNGQTIVVSIAEMAAAETSVGIAAAAATSGTHNVLVLMVNFLDDTRTPADAAAIGSVMSNVDSYFQEVSYGQTSLSPVVVRGWYTLPTQRPRQAFCSYTFVGSLADAAARDDGIDLGQFARIVYFFPSNNDCGFSGVAQIGGSRSWMNGTLTEVVWAHEQGHNYGLFHASAYDCHGLVFDPVHFRDTCTHIEYGNLFDTMGFAFSPYHFSAQSKRQLGWLPSDDVISVSETGIFELLAHEPPGSGPRALLIPAEADGRSWGYYVERRAHFGFDTPLPPEAVDSVLIQTQGSKPHLLDMTPEATYASFFDPGLRPGMTYIDEAGEVAISLLEAGPESARVLVRRFEGATVPQVVITSPASGSLVTVQNALTIQVSATDADGAVQKVEFFDGYAKIGESLAPPFSFVWSEPPSGPHSLWAIALDDDDAAARSAPVSVTLNRAPAVAFTAPADGAVFTAGEPVTITGTASDPDGTVSRVELYRSAEKIAEDLAVPYSFYIAYVPEGTHTLTLRAVDNQGTASTSAPRTFVVRARRYPPVVSISSPADGANLPLGSVVALKAQASDVDGSVTRVEFFNGALKLGEDTAAPYEITWTAAAEGTYSILARATDNEGMQTTSTARRITVSGPVVPNGLKASYYDSKDFTGALVTRTDRTVNFEWGDTAPVPSMGKDGFSVRWTGYLRAESTGTFTLNVRVDDGVRLWVDGRLLIDRWVLQSATEYSAAVALQAGRAVPLTIEYFEESLGATAQLSWSGPSLPKQIVPTQVLFPTNPNPPAGLLWSEDPLDAFTGTVATGWSSWFVGSGEREWRVVPGENSPWAQEVRKRGVQIGIYRLNSGFIPGRRYRITYRCRWLNGVQAPLVSVGLHPSGGNNPSQVLWGPAMTAPPAAWFTVAAEFLAQTTNGTVFLKADLMGVSEAGVAFDTVSIQDLGGT